MPSLHCRNLIWYLIDFKDITQLWSPLLYIGNSLKVKKLPELSKLSSLWFYMPHGLSYYEVFTVWISCSLEFHTYPFDSHTCNLNLKNWIGGRWRVDLNSPKIFTTTDNGELIGGNALFNMTNIRLNYDFNFESLETVTHQVTVGHKHNFVGFALAQVRITLTRNERSQEYIFSSFHLPTAIFALLSHASYLVELEAVPGRMGLLITLNLILANTYNSVDAPPTRGFSGIETWFVGTQAPILLAIVEYVTLLAIKKFFDPKDFRGNGKNISFRTMIKVIDFATFISSLLFFAIFNMFYWYV